MTKKDPCLHFLFGPPCLSRIRKFGDPLFVWDPPPPFIRQMRVVERYFKIISKLKASPIEPKKDQNDNTQEKKACIMWRCRKASVVPYER